MRLSLMIPREKRNRIPLGGLCVLGSARSMDPAVTATTRDLYGCPRETLESWLAEAGLPLVHARNLYRATFKQLSPEPWAGPSFPERLRARCAADWRVGPLPAVVEEHHSQYDFSVKFVLGLQDGARVEAVLMPEKQRITLCLSSQVGCRQGCVFCHTGRMGLVRNLDAAEIVGQLVHADRWIAAHPEWLQKNRLPVGQRVTNVVFMGMGEPLDNVDAVADALRIATDPYGLHLGLRRISVSTAGHLEGLERLVRAVPGVRVALSVHSTDEVKRAKIMPISRRWPLGEVMVKLHELFGPDQRPVMFQYTMIAGVNDDPEEARRLAALARGLNAKVNLIPLNEVSASRLAAPAAERIQAFRDILHAAGLRVMVRYSKAQDIAGACGQLIVQSSNLKRA